MHLVLVLRLRTCSEVRMQVGDVDRHVVEDAARTALAAVASFSVARLLRMPEAYWATISTIIVMQSTLGAALTVSWQRLAGTVLGAASGALLGTYFSSNLVVFGAGVFALGLIAAILRSVGRDRRCAHPHSCVAATGLAATAQAQPAPPPLPAREGAARSSP